MSEPYQAEMFEDSTVLSPELINDLAVLTGGSGNFGAALPSAAKTGQERFLEERSRSTEKTGFKIIKPTILVMDLATEAGRQQYESIIQDVMPLAMADPKGWRFSEASSPVIADPSSDAGYRIIVTIRYWQQEEYKIPGNHGFTVIDAGAKST